MFTLRGMIENRLLTPDTREFCAALLEQGDVLGVTLGYLPEHVLWLVNTPGQAWLMRDKQPDAIVLTLGEATDLAAAVGDPPPRSLWDVAVTLSAAAVRES
ncbi:MAG TPA: hypothetical protein VID28_01775 [Methylomirabilota bacterium]